MELTLEAYRNIVKNVGNRTDLATLCRVCKGFCSAAEKALYNTLSFSHTEETLILLQTLSNNAHLSELVIAVTVFLEEEEEEEEHTSSEDDNSVTGALDNVFIPDSFWSTIANVLKTTKNLRYLHVHFNNAVDPALAWILRGCTFQLRKFHCEFNWDDDLVDFLYSQKILEDLHLSDYRETPKMEGIHRGHTLKPLPLPSLSCLECTFSEAAMKIIPERPITHLKTCFSHSDLGEKRDEMYDLLGKMAQSRKNFRSIDLADSSYTEQFSSELLAAITVKRQLISELRYLGTLVLPINGHERLQFYAQLRRLPKVQCIEFEVSEWEPQPWSGSAQRALAGELELYVPSIKCVIFVLDFDRSVVSKKGHLWKVEPDTLTEHIWRDF